MGWSHGAEIFDPTIELLTGRDNTYGWVISAAVIEEVAFTLLDKLTGEADWDDVDDSLEKFQDCPPVVRAFNRLGWLAPNQYDEEGWSTIELKCSVCSAPVRVNEESEAQSHYVPGERQAGEKPCEGSGRHYKWGY